MAKDRTKNQKNYLVFLPTLNFFNIVLIFFVLSFDIIGWEVSPEAESGDVIWSLGRDSCPIVSTTSSLGLSRGEELIE